MEKEIEIDLEESQKWPEKKEEREYHFCLDCKKHYHGGNQCIHCGGIETKVTREEE